MLATSWFHSCPFDQQSSLFQWEAVIKQLESKSMTLLFILSFTCLLIVVYSLFCSIKIFMLLHGIRALSGQRGWRSEREIETRGFEVQIECSSIAWSLWA